MATAKTKLVKITFNSNELHMVGNEEITTKVDRVVTHGDHTYAMFSVVPNQMINLGGSTETVEDLKEGMDVKIRRLDLGANSYELVFEVPETPVKKTSARKPKVQRGANSTSFGTTFSNRRD